MKHGNEEKNTITNSSRIYQNVFENNDNIESKKAFKKSLCLFSVVLFATVSMLFAFSRNDMGRSGNKNLTEQIKTSGNNLQVSKYL